MEKIISLLDYAVSQNASDMLLTVEAPPVVRIDGKLFAVKGYNRLNKEDTAAIVESMVPAEQMEKLKTDRELDFSLGHKDIRVRGNAFLQKGNYAVSLRLISRQIKSFQELGLPPILEKFVLANAGLIIVTGPGGHGISTTLAAMVDYINSNATKHIITVENPIEYVFQYKKSIVSQREVGRDTISYGRALKNIGREDPNVILVSELPDLETINSALNLAEIGCLVLAGSQALSASQAVERLIEGFPEAQQTQIRQMLSNVLLAVVSQRLVPKVKGGRIAVCEIMIVTPPIKSLIRENKSHQIDNFIATSADEGMISLDNTLASLVSKGEIKIDEALAWAKNPKTLKELIY